MYRLFEHEVDQDWLAEAPWHQIDGEVALVGIDGAKFISWCSEPLQYSIGQSSSSFFSPDALHTVDMSSHPFWRHLVGGTMSMHFVDSTHQILRLDGKDGSVLLSSQYDDGQFQGDCVRVRAIGAFQAGATADVEVDR